jgi:hypothetical protein
MTENPFEMFSVPEDYTSWDRYEEQIDKIDLAPMERQRVRSGLRYFRSLMGEDFLTETIQIAHPFISILTNVAPRERIYLAELAEYLQAFETVENFHSLKERITSRNPDNFAEGLSVLEIAQRFHSAGFSVSFDPRVLVTQRSGNVHTKSPDLKVKDESTSEEVFVEVSRLLVGEAQRKSRRTFEALFNVWDGLTRRYRTEISADDPFGKTILPNIKFYQSMTDQELETIARALNELGCLVLSTDNFAELSIANVVEVGIAPPFDHEAVYEWAKRKDLKHPPVEGPPIQIDEVERAIRKIFDDDKTAKKWQLPDDGPGIVILETNKNLILFTHDIRYVISALEQSVLNEPKLNHIILTLSFTSVEAAGTVLTEIGNHTIVRNSKKDGSIECAVMVHNGTCKTPLSKETMKRLVRVFGSAQ